MFTDRAPPLSIQIVGGRFELMPLVTPDFQVGLGGDVFRRKEQPAAAFDGFPDNLEGGRTATRTFKRIPGLAGEFEGNR
jgi:hypothetical protein